MSGEKWLTYKLKDVIGVFIDYRGKTPTKSGSGIPLITAKIVKNGRVEEPNEFIPEKDFESWMTRGLPENGDVVLTTEAPLGEVAQINFNGKVALAQRIITMRGKKGVLDNSFLKYALQTNKMQERLSGRSTGTTVTGIKSSELREVEIELPNLITQRRIAAILTALDDKIELNRRMNETLEGIAQALWGEWFGGYVSGEEELPEGWRWGNVLEVAKLIGGGTPKTEIEEYWNGSIPWISGKDITPNNRSIIIQTEKSISKMGLENSSAKLLPAFSTVISARGTVGNFCLLASEMTISQSNYALKSTLKNTDFFLFQQVANLVSEMQQKSYGTVFDTITTKTFSEIKIPIPPHSEMVRYDTTMKSIFEKRIETLQESRTLTALRDALLPWLMCGKLLSYFN
jgi:type I restriction enzyme S subunit